MPASQLLRTKSIESLLEESRSGSKALKRTLGVWSLIAFGIGAVIGSGIFTLTGTAAAGTKESFPSILNAPVLDLILHGSKAASIVGRPGAGPGITLSFILVAITCGFAALCYAELAAMIPIAGSAYTYAYTTLGEIFAWIIGWDLILEYAVSNMSVAVGFSAYFNVMCDYLFGAHLPKYLSEPAIVEGHVTGSWFNVPALLIVMLLSWILVRGVKESAGANNLMVAVKVGAVLVFVFGAAHAVQASNLHPFLPNGFPGVLTGAALVFFTYIGFDSVSCAAEETQKSATGHANWHYRHAGRLRDPVCFRRVGADGNRELEDIGQRRTGCQSFGRDRDEPAALHRYGGSAARDVVFFAGVSVRPGAYLVRDVARPFAAGCLFQGA